MTFSMTGYGKHNANYKGRVLTVEIRTLNSKQWDLNLRMPAVYRDKEFEVRDLLNTELYRGKIDVSIQRDLAPGEATAVLNEGLAASYYQVLKRMEKSMQESPSSLSTDYLELVLKMPDVLKPASEDLEDEEYQSLKQVLAACIDKVQSFRLQEGEKLKAMLVESVHQILSNLVFIEPFETERIERIRGRIEGSMSEELEGRKIDKDRLEQEFIFYIEKLDVSEEKMRLKAHCDYFIKTLKEEKFKGKKLSFISQEMGREINTLGSKAQHSEIQRIVVGMKDELEKIKEQVLNIL